MWFSTFLYHRRTVSVPVQCLGFKKAAGKLKKFQGSATKVIPGSVPERLN